LLDFWFVTRIFIFTCHGSTQLHTATSHTLRVQHRAACTTIYTLHRQSVMERLLLSTFYLVVYCSKSNISHVSCASVKICGYYETMSSVHCMFRIVCECEPYDSTATLTFFRVLVDMATPITVTSLCHLPDVSCSRLSRAYLCVSWAFLYYLFYLLLFIIMPSTDSR